MTPSAWYRKGTKAFAVLSDLKDFRENGIVPKGNEANYGRFSVNGDSENVSRIVTPEEWDAAREHFGVTDNAYEAGYILPDGSMLDFSGRNEGARGGSRTIDHRDLGDVIEREGRNGAMYAALEAGAIRLYPEMPGCQIKGIPTEDALWTLREAFDQLKDRDDGIDRDFTVEFQFPYVENGEPTGLSLFRSAAYAPETDSRRIADDVRSFFQTGVVPEGTARFSVGMNYEAKLNDRMKREMVKVSNYRAVDAQASERIEQMPFVVGESASETVGYDYRTETYNDSNFQTAHANPLSKTGLEAARRYFADKGLSRFVEVVNRLKKGKGRVILKPAMRVPDEVETNSLSNTHRIVPCPALTRAFGERLAQLTGALFDTSVTSGYAGVYGADPKHLKPYLVRGIAPEENDAVVIVSGETRDELGIYAMDTDGSASAALAYVRSGVQENSIRVLAKDLVRGESGHAFLTRDTGPVHTLIKRLTPKGARLSRGIESVRGMDGFQSFLDDIALVPPTMIRKIAYADSVLQELVKWLRTDGAKNFADRLAGIKPKAESAKAPVEDSEQTDEAEELRAARDNHWIASLHDNIRDFTLNGNDELFYSATVNELLGGEPRSKEMFDRAQAIMEEGAGSVQKRALAVARMAMGLLGSKDMYWTGSYLLAKFGSVGAYKHIASKCASQVVRRLFSESNGARILGMLDLSRPVSFVYSEHNDSTNCLPGEIAKMFAAAINEHAGRRIAFVSKILEVSGMKLTSLDADARSKVKLSFEGSVMAFDKTQCVYVDDVWSTGKSMISLLDYTLGDENVEPVGIYTLAAGSTARMAKDIFVSTSDLLEFAESVNISLEQIKRDFNYDIRKFTAADFRKATHNRRGNYYDFLGSRGLYRGGERPNDPRSDRRRGSRGLDEERSGISSGHEGVFGSVSSGGSEAQKGTGGERTGLENQGSFSVTPGDLIAAKEIDIGSEPRFSILNRQIVWSELPESLSTVINSTSLAHLESADRNKPARDRFYSLMGERSTWDQEKPEAFAFARNLSTQIGTEWLGRYLLGKHFGDRRAALQVARHFLKPGAVNLIRAARDPKRTLRIVYLQNREGKTLNKLPQMYAAVLEREIGEGVEIDSGIVKVSSDQNTRAAQKDRVSRDFVFENENEIDPAAQYLIVDDTWTSGQTSVSMLDYLRQNGADVIGITTLATGRYGKKIVPTEDQLQRVVKKAKLLSLDQANQVLGFDLGKATGSELHGYILQGKQGPEGLQRWFREVNAPLLPGILPNQGGSGEGYRGSPENAEGRPGVSNTSLPVVGTGREPTFNGQMLLPGIGRFSTAYPQFNGLTDDQLMALAVATDIALGKSDKVSDRSVRVSRVQKIVKQLHPEYTATQLGVEGMRVAKDAQKLAKKIREDLDNGVSQSMIIQYLPDVYREMFGTEMREQARRGSRIGAQNTRAYMALRNRRDKLIEDAVRTQSGVETKLLEGV